MKEYYVYILRCSDGSYYTGVTNDYQSRLNDHQQGLDPKAYTFKRRPVNLVYLATFDDIHEAISWEKRVKRWSRRRKKALIKGKWDELPQLAKCQNITTNFHNPVMRLSRYNIRFQVHVTLSSVEGRHAAVMVRQSSP